MFLSTNILPQIHPSFLFPPDKISQKLDQINKDSVKTLSFSFVGDLMCHSTQINYAKIDSEKYDFKPVFEHVKEYLTQSDFCCGNLETVTAGKSFGYKGYPVFNTPDEFLMALAYAGFDILFTANNHALDQGEVGLKRTIKKINEFGMLNVGTHKKENTDFLFLTKNGIKFALLAYTFGTNGFSLPDTSSFAINRISRNQIKKDLKKANSLSPDFIIVYFHFGKEYELKPNDYQRYYVNLAFENGCDIVIGSHPHVLQNVETRFSEKIGKTFVAYSLGNFVSNQRWRYSDGGVILNFKVKKNILKNELTVTDLNYIPVWVYKGKVDEKGKSGYRIYPIYEENENTPNPFFTKKDTEEMKRFFIDAKKILGKEIKPSPPK